MKTPKQVIDEILKIRFGIGLDTGSSPADVLAHIKDNAKFKDDAARLVAEIHAEEPHFILELIQNAEDNEYDENVNPMIKFIIEEHGLVLQNNERGFVEDDVWALCGIGETTKQDRQQGFIGEKGIGFKSVFMITDEPHIYSNGFQFKFTYDAERPTSIIIPQWVDQVPSCVDPKQTNIMLPLKIEAKRRLSTLGRIDPHLLLFLRKIKTIDIEDKVEKRHERIERNDIGGRIEIVHSGGKDVWLTAKNDLPTRVPEDVKDEKRRGVLESEVILAFPLTPDGSSLDTSREQKIFAYLPIRSYGFKFIIQADFLMPPSREDIYGEKPWNTWLRDNIAPVFVTAVEQLKQDESLKKTYYDCIPLSDEITDPFFRPLVEQIHTALRDVACVLTEDGNWARPAHVFAADDRTRRLISKNDLKSFFDKEYMSSGIKVRQGVLSALEVETFQLDHLLQCLQQTDWLEGQSDGWFIELYSYLASQKLSNEQLRLLKKACIIRLENGNLASVSEQSIFLPLARRRAYGFEEELRVVRRALLNGKDEARRLGATQFLEKLGVRTPAPYEIIEHHILPLYEREDDEVNWRTKDHTTLLGYVRYIKDHLSKYEEQSVEHSSANDQSMGPRADPLERLTKVLLVRTDRTIDGSDYDRPQNVYLPKIYGNENDLENLFEGIEGIRYVHREYIDSTAKKNSRGRRKSREGASHRSKQKADETRMWKDLLTRIGVEDKLRVLLDPRTVRTRGDPVESLPHTRAKRTFDWEDSNWGYHIEGDYVSPDLEPILADMNPERAHALIRILEKKENWDYYATRLQCRYWYHKPHTSYWHGDASQSSFAALLQSEAWLPTTQGTFAKPREVFLANPKTKALLGDSVCYLAADLKNDDFIKSLGINREASVDGVLNHLTTLTEIGCSDKKIFAALYAFLERSSYEDTEGRIRGAFSERRIIFIPETSQRYFESGEVLWKDATDVFGENRGYLEKHYLNLRVFFVEDLGVSESPRPKDYADVLLSLSQKEETDRNVGRIALRVYQELNANLDPGRTETPISEEDWWDDFVREPIFWTNKREFWFNNNDVFVNNAPELYQLFKDTPEVAFLELHLGEYPRLRYFLQAVRVPLLSEAVRMELIGPGGTAKATRDDLSKLIRGFQAPISRYLFYEEKPEAYERAKEEGILTQLGNLSVYEVERLEVSYTLGPMCVTAPRRMLLHRGHLYVQSESLRDTDSLAVELSKLFGELKGLDSFLVSLFDKKTQDKIENLLQAKGIHPLPETEKAWLERADGTTEKEMIAEARSGRIPDAEAPSVPIQPDQESGREPPEAAVALTLPERPPDEEVGWQPECRPEEAQVRIEKFQAPEAKQPAPAGAGVGTTEAMPIALDEEHGARDQLSQADRFLIGEWGEEYALECLKHEMKEKYPTGVIEHTQDGFHVHQDAGMVATVHWLNRLRDRGVGCDIEVIESDRTEHVEVKSTTTDGKEWFDVTKAQWELAQESGDRFHLFLVRRAGSTHPELHDMRDPVKLWREGGLVAHPVRIRI